MYCLLSAVPSSHLQNVQVFTEHDRQEALAGLAIACNEANICFGQIYGMIADDSAGGPDHVVFQDVCARLEAGLATAKLSAGQKKPFEVIISVAQGWSKLRVASSMTSSAGKLFKGDLLDHVGPLQARLTEARAIVAAEPAEFRLAGHDVRVDVVKSIMDTSEKEATNVAKGRLFAEFQDLEKKALNFARMMSLLPSPEDKKRYLGFFKQKDQSVKDVTSLIDKLEKQWASLKERVEKFGVVTGSDEFEGYDGKMEEFHKRLHDGDSAVSCQALVMLLSNPKVREPGGTHLRALLDQVLLNFLHSETHKAHVAPAAILEEGRGIAAAFRNKDDPEADPHGAEDDKEDTGASSKGRKKASDPSDTAAENTGASSKGRKKARKDDEAVTEDGKPGEGGARGEKRGDKAGAEAKPLKRKKAK